MRFWGLTLELKSCGIFCRLQLVYGDLVYDLLILSVILHINVGIQKILSGYFSFLYPEAGVGCMVCIECKGTKQSHRTPMRYPVFYKLNYRSPKNILSSCSTIESSLFYINEVWSATYFTIYITLKIKVLRMKLMVAFV